MCVCVCVCLCVCASHLYLPPDVRWQFFDGIGSEQHGRQLPESGAPPQLNRQLLIGQLHADRQAIGDQSEDGNSNELQESKLHLVPALLSRQHHDDLRSDPPPVKTEHNHLSMYLIRYKFIIIIKSETSPHLLIHSVVLLINSTVLLINSVRLYYWSSDNQSRKLILLFIDFQHHIKTK